ncbi:MAG: ester cyclase [Verrucomicrobia bacterium]|nr:ester cyclase [Verrucomicrobiota bacterium]
MLPVESVIPQVLLDYMEGLRTHDVDLIASTLAEDVRFVTPAKTMGKAEILEFLTALYRGFPDWSYDHDGLKQLTDGGFAVRWRQGGTHTASLEFPGFAGVAPTGKTVAIPEHNFFYKIKNNLLVEIRPDPIPGGAPRGIFEQIGVELPPL